MSEFTKIQDYLKKYDPDSRQSLADAMFQKGEFMVSWFINNLCNFSCEYCGHYTTEHPSVGKYSVEHIVKSFRVFGNSGHIIITGGEPFLFPGFVDLCKELTKENFISVNTNLSHKLVTTFAEEINPNRVIMINAGIHFDFRRSKQIEMDDFVKKFILLHEKGFNIIGSFVVHPEHMEAMEKDIELLKSLGISAISAKSFSGISKGKKYPLAYTTEELNRIIRHMNGQIDMPEYLKYYRFKGKKCSTGKDFFSIDPGGNLSRCNSDDTPFGNIFEGTFMPSEKVKKCSKDECLCPYQGMIYSSKKQSWF